MVVGVHRYYIVHCFTKIIHYIIQNILQKYIYYKKSENSLIIYFIYYCDVIFFYKGTIIVQNNITSNKS